MKYPRRKMGMKFEKNGLVFTNDKCVGCNKCISVCSCMGATVAEILEDGKNIIEVDGAKCIACGACFDVCAHGAFSGSLCRNLQQASGSCCLLK